MSAREGAARVVAVAIEKGGVAKSATAEAFAAELVARGFRVLCVDLDAQEMNLSYHVGASKTVDGPDGRPVPAAGVYDLLKQRVPTEKGGLACVQGAGPFGDVVVADKDVALLDAELDARYRRGDVVLERALAPLLPLYDYVIVDTPPAMQVRTLSAMAVADDVIVVTTPSANCYGGIVGLTSSMQSGVCDVLGRGVHVAGIAVTMVRSTSPAFNRKGLADIREISENTGWRVFRSRVTYLQAVDEAQKANVPLREWAPASPATREYAAMVDEYLALGAR